MSDSAGAQRIAYAWQPARLDRGADGRARLVFDDPADCARCRSGTGCGAATLGRLFGRRAVSIPAPAHVDWPDGTRVRVGVPARLLLTLAVGQYLLPLLAFLAGVLVAGPIGGGDAVALALGLAAGTVALAGFRRLAPGRAEPRVELAAPGCSLETTGVR
ncbi:MAG: SoxR reducing system RseC family protein [Wenzhouxiangellaceae bacterium]|nr:SoxR reducing system RseC family protein [Wenzhouxiangellaceae bacterium]